ncbi:T9SS type B sorting domain-containing protein [Flavobacterium sp. Sd200]|uniref:T9SS type B sorting domain-containing protein n=1 Tax=Flavobacterium sp. Sd200 TaxID=2692211 RepID=UPI001367ABE4|nr:gliding motility-associated C-terminal domain-containing protein [Flavobacterium sp. Sd200]MXN92998.1 T9SS type B sorting domain-containing protein [Flavobacterium sp. Sd200]
MNKIKAFVFLFFCFFIFSHAFAQPSPSCPVPTNIAAINTTDTEAEFIWQSAGTETEWEIIIQMEGTAPPASNVSGESVSAMSYFADFIIPLTGYDVYVRAICSSTQYSAWSAPYNYYSPVANDSCANATVLSVNRNDRCTQSTSAMFMGSTPSPEAGSCSVFNDGDIWFAFTATGTVHAVSLSNFAGTPLPIVLTMYEGADCSNLNQLYCSNVNYIMAHGLTTGQTYYIRAAINQAGTPRDVTFDICVNTPNLSNNNNGQCLINTVNNDFENPAYTSNSVNFINHHAMQGWRTTASDGIIEVWNNYQSVQAYSGSQFIELNAYEASGVYQDFSTPVSTTITYSFAHRGRQGTDICGLYAGPPEGPYELIYTATTGTSAWGFYTGTYTVPTGQTETRFKFEAISAAGGLTVGNFLDAISFTANNGILSQNPVTLNCNIDMATLIVAGGDGTWTVNANNPSITVMDDIHSNSPTITGFSAPGIYMYTWTTLYCTDTLLVEYFGSTINAPVVSNVSYCQNETAAPLSAAVTALPGHIIKWYTAQTGGTALTQEPLADTSVTGTITYYVSQTSLAGTCESPRVPLTVTVNQPTPVVVTLNYEFDEYCLPSTATLVPQPGTLAGGNFTADNGLIIDRNTGSINLAAAVAGQYIITYVIPANTVTCTAEGRVTFNLELKQSVVPDGNFYYDSFCYDDTVVVPTTATGFVFGGTFQSAQGLNLDTNTGVINVAASTPGQYIINYYLAPNPQQCRQEGRGTATVVINQPAVFTVTGECSATNYLLTVEGLENSSNSYTWTDASGNQIGTDDKVLNVTDYLRLNPGTVIPAGGLLFNVAVNYEGCVYNVPHTVTSAFCSIQKGISPNGDDFNQSFDLTGLGVQKLVIYNRYGKSVYEHQANYTNQWHGQTDKGDELPTGTYFYYIMSGDNREITGWIYINR